MSLWRLLGLAVAWSGAAAAAEPPAAPLPVPTVAVVPFVGDDEADEVKSVLESDLALTGRLRVYTDTQAFPRAGFEEEADFPVARQLGVDYLVVGGVYHVEGRLVIRFYLLSVGRGRREIAFDMPSVPVEAGRAVVHQVADIVYERLTGRRGVFSSRIAYVMKTGSGDGAKYAMTVADFDGHDAREIARSRSPLMSPVWSPDGRKLAYVGFERGQQAVYVHELATGGVRKLVAEKGINSSPSWSPDGRQLLVTLSFGTNPDIYLIDVASGERKRLTENPAIDTEAVFSPDGSQIAFTSDRDGRPQIYLMPAAGGEARRLTLDGKLNMGARFAPDGKGLAVVNQDAGSYAIGFVDLQSGHVRRLTEGPLDSDPSFSPDSDLMIYLSEKDGVRRFATQSIDGRVRFMSVQSGQLAQPSWGPRQRQ